ncbi:MAG: hypothetical protein MUW56_06860 [Chryseobacterium sp.]|uniref:hypothetical protein n=1 Tax=Chryseobacterium sp. TaxID=1871047 RepID=UPI0025BFA95E|nr:hypothetical protein [Chryseobacterium sp.]MCJ7933353.1 hypothetical protein [Chryseobacterium sp.]
MKAKTIELNLIQENIKHLSTDGLGTYIAVTSQNNIVAFCLETPLHLGMEIIMVKIIDEEKILIIVDQHNLIDNALIIDYNGNIKVRFTIGEHINDIKINAKKIIVSYFDQGVLGNYGPNNDAVAVFNFKGQQLYGYNSNTTQEKLIDCYCLANMGNQRIIFNGYGNFSLQELDLNTLHLTSYETPSQCIGAGSISAKAGNIIFHSTYKDKSSFFVWNLKSNEVYQIHSGFTHITGTDNGVFYKVDKKSFILIHPIE